MMRTCIACGVSMASYCTLCGSGRGDGFIVFSAGDPMKISVSFGLNTYLLRRVRDENPLVLRRR